MSIFVTYVQYMYVFIYTLYVSPGSFLAATTPFKQPPPLFRPSPRLVSRRIILLYIKILHRLIVPFIAIGQFWVCTIIVVRGEIHLDFPPIKSQHLEGQLNVSYHNKLWFLTSRGPWLIRTTP